MKRSRRRSCHRGRNIPPAERVPKVEGQVLRFYLHTRAMAANGKAKTGKSDAQDGKARWFRRPDIALLRRNEP
jgi:hypothetical protein